MQVNSISPIPETKPSFEKVPDKFEQPARPVEKGKQLPGVPDKTKALDDLQTTLKENNITLSFSRDEQTKALVVRLVDNVTGEAIRQIPTEVSLKLVAVNARLQGLFVDQQS